MDTKKNRSPRRLPKVQKPTLESISSFRYRDFGYIVGVLMGDGHLEKKRKYVILKVKDKSFIEAFKKSVNRVFRLSGQIYYYVLKDKYGYAGRYPIYSLTIRKSSLLGNFLEKTFGSFRTFEWRINDKLFEKLGRDFCKGFVAGFFDSEGCVSCTDTCFRLSFYSGNKLGLLGVQRILDKLFCVESRFVSRKTRRAYSLNINKFKSICLFRDSFYLRNARKRKKLPRLIANIGIRKIWSKEEDYRLKNLYRDESIKVERISKIIGRDVKSIIHRVSKLISAGYIKRRKKKTICDITGARRWKKSDVDKLVRAYASGVDSREIARSLKRSYQSVFTKLCELRNCGFSIKRRGLICH